MRSRIWYDRESIEFSRVVSLTDAIFSVAMTLLVVSIGIPRVEPDDLSTELIALHGEILTFFISVAVLSFYWLSNHRFIRHIQSMDPVFVGLNLVFLVLIAFLPFPTALLDRYSGEWITLVLYLSTLLLISLMEVALFVRAHRLRCFSFEPSPYAVRYSVLISVLPVLVFALAIPIGLTTSPTVGLFVWVLINFPLRIALDRKFGPGSEETFL